MSVGRLLNGRKRYDYHTKHFWDVKYRWKLKMDVLRYYSVGHIPQCAWCSESDVRVLCIDHLNGNGADQKRELGRHGDKFYNWLRREGYPDGYQVLCMNCNTRKNYEEHNLYSEDN